MQKSYSKELFACSTNSKEHAGAATEGENERRRGQGPENKECWARELILSPCKTLQGGQLLRAVKLGALVRL